MAVTRRAAGLGGLALALAPGAFARGPDAIAALERAQGGRLGVCILDVATGRRMAHRADERFALCSTFKVLAAAMILTRVDRGAESLDRRVVYTDDDVVSYSPETAKHAGVGMALGDVCQAALTLSDNTAGNLMVQSLGGPAALTAFACAIGDPVTRLDRLETALNEAAPGDARDTTTPDGGLRIVTVYYAESGAGVDERNAVIAAIGRLAAGILDDQPN